MGTIREYLFKFAVSLNDQKRAIISGSLGAGLGILINRLEGWTWQLSILLGWILATSSFLILQAIVLISADGPMTRERVSDVKLDRRGLMLLTVFLSIIGTGIVGQLLTAVSKNPLGHSRLLVQLSVVAVLLAWVLLHTSFAVHYARLFYEAKDIHGHPFKEGRRSGFRFPGTETPTYLDFLYISFTVALTYSMSDVDVENPVIRQTVLIHSLVSFFFYAVVVGGVLNAILTS
jgi:uncharacterized membrane protein